MNSSDSQAVRQSPKPTVDGDTASPLQNETEEELTPGNEGEAAKGQEQEKEKQEIVANQVDDKGELEKKDIEETEEGHLVCQPDIDTIDTPSTVPSISGSQKIARLLPMQQSMDALKQKESADETDFSEVIETWRFDNAVIDEQTSFKLNYEKHKIKFTTITALVKLKEEEYHLLLGKLDQCKRDMERAKSLMEKSNNNTKEANEVPEPLIEIDAAINRDEAHNEERVSGEGNHEESSKEEESKPGLIIIEPHVEIEEPIQPPPLVENKSSPSKRLSECKEDSAPPAKQSKEEVKDNKLSSDTSNSGDLLPQKKPERTFVANSPVNSVIRSPNLRQQPPYRPPSNDLGQTCRDLFCHTNPALVDNRQRHMAAMAHNQSLQRPDDMEYAARVKQERWLAAHQHAMGEKPVVHRPSAFHVVDNNKRYPAVDRMQRPPRPQDINYRPQDPYFSLQSMPPALHSIRAPGLTKPAHSGGMTCPPGDCIGFVHQKQDSSHVVNQKPAQIIPRQSDLQGRTQEQWVQMRSSVGTSSQQMKALNSSMGHPGNIRGSVADIHATHPGAIDLRVQKDLARLEEQKALNAKCDMCPNAAAFLCSSCKRAAYCGRACQVQGWTYHKPTCSFRS